MFLPFFGLAGAGDNQRLFPAKKKWSFLAWPQDFWQHISLQTALDQSGKATTHASLYLSPDALFADVIL